MTKWQGSHLLEGHCISAIGRDGAASLPQNINMAVVQPKGQLTGLNTSWWNWQGELRQPLLPVERHAQQDSNPAAKCPADGGKISPWRGQDQKRLRKSSGHALKSSEHQKENSQIYRIRDRW